MSLTDHLTDQQIECAMACAEALEQVAREVRRQLYESGQTPGPLLAATLDHAEATVANYQRVSIDATTEDTT